MRRKLLRNRKKISAGKLVTGILLGGAVGVAVRWLIESSSGDAWRRSLNEKIKTSDGNVESQARELAEDVNNRQNLF